MTCVPKDGDAGNSFVKFFLSSKNLTNCLWANLSFTLDNTGSSDMGRLLHNNNNNLFIYGALFNMLGDQKRITTINNLKTIQILKVYKYI